MNQTSPTMNDIERVNTALDESKNNLEVTEFTPSEQIINCEALELNKEIIPRYKRILIFIGLALSVFLASLDLTIVSTALPVIGTQLNSIGDITWIPTSYMLTSTIVLPIQGKLTDIFGRKQVLISSVTIFLLGSLMCGIAPNFTFLIVARAIAGIGGGGLPSLAVIVISDLVPLNKRAKYMGIISAVFGVSSIVGPLLGGVIVDHIGWRFLFYINLPIGFAALLVIVLYLPNNLGLVDARVRESVLVKLKRVDWLGSMFLVFSNVCLLLGLNWAGQQYSWSNPIIYSLLISSIILLIIFIIIELKYSKEPIIDYKIFNTNTLLALLCSFFMGYIMYNITYYLPLFYQIVRGNSATLSGLKLIPNLFSFVVFSIVSGIISSSIGKYLPFIHLGSFLASIGVGLLSLLRLHPNYGVEVIFIIIVGSGLGLSLQNLLLCSHANVKHNAISSITTLITFARMIGGIFGLAIEGTIINNVLRTKLLVDNRSISYKQLLLSIENIKLLNTDQSLAIRKAYVDAFRILFLSLVPIAVIWFIASLFIKHRSLATKIDVKN